MKKAILFFIVFIGLIQVCLAQDSITMNDAKIIKARSEIIIERYLNNLLNTISYTGADFTDIKDLINQSFEDSDKRIFLNKQIAVADDVTDPYYTKATNSPEVPVSRYLNAFNTFYSKSDTNSVFFSNVRSSPVKKGKKNIYINVYFTSILTNHCRSNPGTPYKSTRRVAELFVQKGANNKWVLYISRIGYYIPSDTINNPADNMAIISTKGQPNQNDGIERPNQMQQEHRTANEFTQLLDQAHLEEKKRNYQSAIGLYTQAIAIMPDKKNIYEPKINDLSNSIRTVSNLEENYRAGYYKDAIKGYSELIKRERTNTAISNSDYYLGRAKCYDKMGQLTRSYNEQVKNYSDALLDYSKSFDYDNDNLETIQCRADLYKRMNRNIEALTEYKTYLAKDPADLTVYESISEVHMLSGNLDEAIKDIDVALSQGNIDPGFKSQLHVDKGYLLARKKNYSVAEDYFTRAIELDGNNALAYYNRGLCRIKMNKIPGAMNDFNFARLNGLDSTRNMYSYALQGDNKFLAINPNRAPASFNYEIGNIYLNIGKYDSAYSYLVRSYQSDPSNGYILYSMASCIYLQGKTEESLLWFERSFKTNAFVRSFVDQDALLGTLQADRRFKELKKKYL